MCNCNRAKTYETLLSLALIYVTAYGTERAYDLAELIAETIADYKKGKAS